MPKSKKEVDINLNINAPGLKDLGEATKEIATKTTDGAIGFLRAICVPAAEQFGKALEDKVKEWRYINFINFIDKTKKLHKEKNIDPKNQINPRIMIEIGEEVSKQDDDTLQNWWAGITVSACDKNPTDEQLIFVNLMKKITRLQAKILSYSCTNSTIQHSPNDEIIISKPLIVTRDELIKLTGIDNIHTLDRELDSLSSIGLLAFGGGFNISEKSLHATITPSALALHFYARCQGEAKDLNSFYSSILMDKSEMPW